jgi:hypothetical protein
MLTIDLCKSNFSVAGFFLIVCYCVHWFQVCKKTVRYSFFFPLVIIPYPEPTCIMGANNEKMLHSLFFCLSFLI